MDALNTASPIHFYDTRLHEILCGVRGFAHRSTKHSRGVTCPACVGLLGKQSAAAATRADEASSHVAAP